MFGNNGKDGCNNLPDLYEDLPENIFDDEDIKVLNVEPADLLIADLADLNKEEEVEISNNFSISSEDNNPALETLKDILMEDSETDKYVDSFEDNFTVNVLPDNMVVESSEDISRKVEGPKYSIQESSAELSSSSLSSDSSSDSSDMDDMDVTRSVSPQWSLDYTCDLGLVFRNIHNSICEAISKSPSKQSVLGIIDQCLDSTKTLHPFFVEHGNSTRSQVVSPSGFPSINTARKSSCNTLNQLHLNALEQHQQLSTAVPCRLPFSTMDTLCVVQNTEFLKQLLEEETRAEQHRLMLMFLARMVIKKHGNGRNLNISTLEDYYSCFRLMMAEKEKSKNVMYNLQNYPEAPKNRSKLDRVNRLIAENDQYAAKTWYGLFVARTLIRIKGASELISYDVCAKELASLIVETESWNVKKNDSKHLLALKDKHSIS